VVFLLFDGVYCLIHHQSLAAAMTELIDQIHDRLVGPLVNVLRERPASILLFLVENGKEVSMAVRIRA
jgi:hypothetical protein